MKRPMYHALEINKANEELAAENLRLLEQIKELETARESDLAFFGATLEEDGGLHIDMKKYHAAHICKEHQWLPKEERLIEDRCPICIKSQIDDLERQLAEVRSPSTTPTDLTEQARQLVAELDRKLERHRGSGCAGAQCPDFQEEQVRAIASFAAEAATQGQKEDEYVAWCRYTHEGVDESGADIGTIVTCDSDAKGAFKVYRALSPDPSILDRVRNEAATAERRRIKEIVWHYKHSPIGEFQTKYKTNDVLAAIGNDKQEALESLHGKSRTSTPETPGRKTTSTS